MPYTLRFRARLTSSIVLTLALAGCASSSGEDRGKDAGERIGLVSSELPAGPIPTSAAPLIETTFTKPTATGNVPGNSQTDTAIRDQVGFLIGNAVDVGSATDVHITAYDWDPFWSTGPSLPGAAWPDTACGTQPCGFTCAPGAGGTCNTCQPSWNVVQSAIDRQLEVKAVFNQGKSKEQVRTWLENAIDAHTSFRGIETCNRGMNCSTSDGGSCLGDSEMHVKVALVRKFDFQVGLLVHTGAEFNTFSTSANFDYHQLFNWNDAVTVYNDKLLYEGIRSFFDLMWRRAGCPDPTRSDCSGPSRTRYFPKESDNLGLDTIDGSLGIVRAYLFPRNEHVLKQTTPDTSGHEADIVYRILSNVKSGRVLIAVAQFSRTNLRDLLIDMRKRNIDVRLIVPEETSSTIIQPLVANQVNVFKTTRGVNFGSIAGVGIHHKFFLTRGDYNGTWQRLVFAGSHNWTGTGLQHNDELLLKIRECETPPCVGTYDPASTRTGTAPNNDAFRQYATHWNALCSHVVTWGGAAPSPPTTRLPASASVCALACSEINTPSSTCL